MAGKFLEGKNYLNDESFMNILINTFTSLYYLITAEIRYFTNQVTHLNVRILTVYQVHFVDLIPTLGTYIPSLSISDYYTRRYITRGP